MATSLSVTFTVTFSTFSEEYSEALPDATDCVSVTVSLAVSASFGAVTVTVWGALHMPVPDGVKVSEMLLSAFPPALATRTAVLSPLEIVTVTSALGFDVRTTVYSAPPPSSFTETELSLTLTPTVSSSVSVTETSSAVTEP